MHICSVELYVLTSVLDSDMLPGEEPSVVAELMAINATFGILLDPRAKRSFSMTRYIYPYRQHSSFFDQPNVIEVHSTHHIEAEGIGCCLSS